MTMKDDDILRMAREAGFGPEHTRPQDSIVRKGFALSGEFKGYKCTLESLSRFAALVAAAEREECGKMCDSKVNDEYRTGKVDHNEMSWTQACAIAIRARGMK